MTLSASIIALALSSTVALAFDSGCPVAEDTIAEDVETLVSLGYISADDSDSDGLPDEYESDWCGTDAASADGDGDSLSDFDELEYGTDPYNADTDGGGVSDGDEIWSAGTDPLDGSDDPTRRVFVTSTAYTADLTGLVDVITEVTINGVLVEFVDGVTEAIVNGVVIEIPLPAPTGVEVADGICKAHAQEAGLGGDWVAWLSDSTVDAIDHIGSRAGTIVRVDGEVIAASLTALTSTGPLVQLLDENNQSLYRYLWTGTGPDGRLVDESQTCSAWSSASASLPAHPGFAPYPYRNFFTYHSSGDCSQQNSLLCFER